jgi:hypothetical protein
VWGAQGGYDGLSGRGGYSKGSLSLTSAINIYIVVGGKGNIGSQQARGKGGAGGYNGGGNGGQGNINEPTGSVYGWGGAGGGGASHIAIKNNRGVLKNYINNKSEVLIVAGGGGGACQNYDMINSNVKSGGDGGGLNGSKGIGQNNNSSYNVNGGSQNSGYTFGVGQNANTKTAHNNCGAEGNGGGGGGWYGGSGTKPNGSGDNDKSGSGGSGYIKSTLTDANTLDGQQTFKNPQGQDEAGHSGNGFARITYMHNPNPDTIDASQVSYSSEYTSCTDVECALNELYSMSNS